jgi:TnpA family transposase
MLQGLLSHATDLTIEQNYTDTHGQSEIGFAFCHLLGFELRPRFKNIYRQKLYLPGAELSETYPGLLPVTPRPINWQIIQEQYSEMVKFATALRLGTANAEAILRRFSRANASHPTYQALAELGKAVKTVFLAEYLHSETLRRQIQAGLNTVERWNGVNDFIFFGKSGELNSSNLEGQEISVLCLHLLQLSLVYVNTLMLQKLLSEPAWQGLQTAEQLSGMTPLLYAHITPYGTFRLDLGERLDLSSSEEEALA